MNPKDSRALLSVAIKTLGVKKVSKIFGVSDRHVYSYAANPLTCEYKSLSNPIERVQALIYELWLVGREEEAEAFIDIFARQIQCRCQRIGEIESDKGSVDGEIADLVIQVGELSRIVRDAIKDGKITREERISIHDVLNKVKTEAEELASLVGV